MINLEEYLNQHCWKILISFLVWFGFFTIVFSSSEVNPYLCGIVFGFILTIPTIWIIENFEQWKNMFKEFFEHLFEDEGGI
ncbi:MAG: hypothetical protein KAJ44_00505 [Thermoplasmatales archaeon]|nr:hypothetical protein [Thermoplasmatales archaeon]